jgi:phosphonate degradation associated HDIG domain protein
MRATSVSEVVSLYERFGDDHYDEAISQGAHALQTAALGESAGAPPELVAAALLHDVGHLLDLEGHDDSSDRSADLRHEAVGAAYLASLFPPAVTGPIALHVRAKRYLCATDPGYTARLSEGSLSSLERQGGPMSGDEVASFERLGFFAGAVSVRRWDDAAKVVDLAVPSFSHFAEVLAAVVRSDI